MSLKIGAAVLADGDGGVMVEWSPMPHGSGPVPSHPHGIVMRVRVMPTDRKISTSHSRWVIASAAFAAVLAVTGSAQGQCVPKNAEGAACVVPGSGRVVAVEGGEIREQIFVNRCDADLSISYRWAGDTGGRRRVPAGEETVLRCNAARCTGELNWGAICEGETEPGQSASLSVSGPAVEASPPAEAVAAAPQSAPIKQDIQPAPQPVPVPPLASAPEPPTPARPVQPEAEPPSAVPDPIQRAATVRAPQSAESPGPSLRDGSVERSKRVSGENFVRQPVPNGALPANMTEEALDRFLLGQWRIEGQATFVCEAQTTAGTVAITDRVAPYFYRGRAALQTQVELRDGCRLMHGRPARWAYAAEISVAVLGEEVAVTWHRVTEMNPGGTTIYRLDGERLATKGNRLGGSFEEVLLKRSN